jgi:cytochrome c oxidase subunit 3
MAGMVTNTSAATGTQTVEGTKSIAERLRGGGGSGSKPGGGNGGGSNGRSWRDDDARREALMRDRYRIGMWVAIASIVMMFTALTSAYIVRAGISTDWRPIAAPPFVWVSTVLILASSFVIEAARRAARRGAAERLRALLFVALLLGLGFVGSQIQAWRQLVEQGIYVSTNPHSSFFYVLTGLHGVHVLGGILGLNYLLFRLTRANGDRRRAAAVAKYQTLTDTVALYWHFMDGLWIYLFLLLFLWR